MQRDYNSEPEEDNMPDIFDQADLKYENHKLKIMENQAEQSASEQIGQGESAQVESIVSEQSTSNELTVVIEQSGVERSTALTLLNSFMPFLQQAKEWDKKAHELVVTDASQVREMQMARAARLALRGIRIEADKKRKALKEDSLRYGKAVQGVYNVIDFLIAPIETHLKEQEDFVKIQEAKMKAAIKDQRDAELAPYIEFVPYQVDLGELTEAAWQTVLNGAKLQKQAKIDEEAKAERDRIALEEKKKTEEYRRNKMFELGLKWNGQEFIFRDINFHWTDLICMKDDEFETAYAGAVERKKQIEAEEAAEAERIRLDNERLRAEAIERDRKATEALAEQKRLADIAKKRQEEAIAKADKERKELEEKNERERKKREEKAQRERDAAAKLMAEKQAETDRLAAEIKAREDAEKAEAERLAKIEADKIAEQKKLEKAPDKEKLTTWINQMEVPGPSVTTAEGIAMCNNIMAKLESFKNWALTQIEIL